MSELEQTIKKEASRKAAVISKATDPDGWGDAWPLDDGRREPLDTLWLPSALRERVEWVADAAMVAPEVSYTAEMGLIAGIAGSRASIQIAEAWKEPLNLYMAVVAGTGDGKTPGFKPASDQLRLIEIDTKKDAEEDHFAATAELMINEQSVKGARKAGNELELAGLMKEQASIRDRAAVIGDLTVKDTSPESLTELLAVNGERVIILDSEGTMMFHILGGYNDRTNIDLFLNAWSGDSYDRRRTGRERPSHIDQPRLTIAVAIQPVIAGQLFANDVLMQRGFLSRFLWAHPERKAGTRLLAEQRAKNLPSPPPFTLPDAGHTTYRFDRDAAEMFEASHDELERSIGGLSDEEASDVPKTRSSVARIAALFTIIEGGEVVTGEAMAMALKLGRFHRKNAASLRRDATQLDAARAVEQLISMNGTKPTVRELTKKMGLHHGQGGTDRVIAALTIAAEYGWVRPVGSDSFGGSDREIGKKSPHIELRPDAKAAWDE